MLSQSVQGPFTGDIESMNVLHDVMKYMPYNRRTLTAMRCVSKPFRSAVQSNHSPWSGHKDVMLSRYGQCILFNAQETEDGKSSFELYSVSPIGRKFRNVSAKTLSRSYALVANGLTKLALHHSHVDNSFFEPLGALTNLRELELVSCRSVTAVGDARRIKSLEHLAVAFCPLEPDGVRGLLLPKLKKLVLRSCYKLSNLNNIDPVTVGSLEELTVEHCNVFDNTANVFFSHVSSNLRELHIGNVPIQEVLMNIPEDARREGLMTLRIVDTSFTMEVFEDMAPSLSEKLEFLSIESCRSIGSAAPLSTLRALRFLDLSRTDIMDDLDSIAMCSRLELFRIANTEIQTLSYLSALTNLRVLDAAYSAICDYELMYLEGSPVLDTVVLTGCAYICNINVLRTCPSIRRIFCASTGVTDEGAALLVECQHLEELVLKFCLLTDANFLVDIPSLKTINVCGTVADMKGVQALLDRRDIEVLCDSFDDEMVE